MLSLPTQPLLRDVGRLLENKNVRLVVSTSAMAAAGTAISTFASGLIAGPRGFVFGGLLGGLLSSYFLDGRCKSLVDVLINDISKSEQEKLASDLKKLFTLQNVTSIAELMIRVQSSNLLYRLIFEVFEKFFKDLGMKLLSD